MVIKNQSLLDAIESCLQSGPKVTAELRAQTNSGRYEIGNAIRTLLRTGRISRVQISVGRFRYYTGQTAPGYEGYHPDHRRKTHSACDFDFPVIQKTYWTGDRVNRVTLPAIPGMEAQQ